MFLQAKVESRIHQDCGISSVYEVPRTREVSPFFRFRQEVSYSFGVITLCAHVVKIGPRKECEP